MSLITSGQTQYVFQNDYIHIVGKRITLKDIKQIPAGYGGYISIIPKCTKDDKTYHILCDMFWQKYHKCGFVIGDFGTGVKKYERPYDVLYDGLEKKMPTWTDLIKFQIESDKTEISCIEYIHATQNDVRYAIAIMVDITPFLSILDELLVLTKEIRDLKAYEEIDRSVLLSHKLSHGLLYYREYITYMQMGAKA